MKRHFANFFWTTLILSSFNSNAATPFYLSTEWAHPNRDKCEQIIPQTLVKMQNLFGAYTPELKCTFRASESKWFLILGFNDEEIFESVRVEEQTLDSWNLVTEQYPYVRVIWTVENGFLETQGTREHQHVLSPAFFGSILDCKSALENIIKDQGISPSCFLESSCVLETNGDDEKWVFKTRQIASPSCKPLRK